MRNDLGIVGAIVGVMLITMTPFQFDILLLEVNFRAVSYLQTLGKGGNKTVAKRRGFALEQGYLMKVISAIVCI